MSDELTGPMVDNSHSSYNAGSGNTPSGPSNSGTPTGYNRRINGNAGNGAGGANGNGGHPTHYDQLPSVVSPSYEPRKMMRDMSADRDMQDTVVDMGSYPYDDSTSIPKMRRFSTTGLTPSDEKMMVTLLEKLEHVSTSLPGPEATTVHHRKWNPLVLNPSSGLMRWWVNYMHNPLIPPVEVSPEVQALPEGQLIGRMTVNFMRKLLAEMLGGFIGTFWAGTIRVLVLAGNTDLTGVTLQIAGMIIAIIYAMAHISGGHFNTAVTWMFTLKGIFPLKWMWSYMIAQLIGGILAGGFLLAFFGQESGQNSVNHWTPDTVPGYTVHSYNAMFMEAVTFFLLGLVVLMCLKQIEKVGLVFPIIVGWTLISMGQINGVYTGWSSNPIRTVGPCLVFGNCYSLGVWIYVAGPLIGATVTVPIVWLLDHKNRMCEKVACCGGAVSPMY